MKKLISGMFIGVFVSLLVFNFTSYAETSGNVVKLIVNGVTLQDELQPISLDNHVYVSAKSLAEALHCEVSWNSNQNAVIINSIKVDVVKPVAPDVNNDPVINKVNPVVDDKVKTDTNVNKTNVNTTVTEPVNSENANNPLKLNSIGETTYKPQGTQKRAYVNVVITNTSDKYMPFIRLKPILNVNDGRTFTSGLDYLTPMDGEYFKPNSTINLTYYTQIPNDIEIIGWELP